VDGIGLPGHFIAAARVDGEQVLLDPFNGGALLTAEACQELVTRALGRPVELEPAHFSPVTNRQILIRMLTNLKAIYWQAKKWEKAVSVIDRLVAVAPEAGAELRDRGLAWSRLGETQRGLADWERYLREFPNAPDHERVKEEFRRVRQNLARLN
jgi:regulator of sirC expression with transglutaminase-like and TPR domain